MRFVFGTTERWPRVSTSTERCQHADPEKCEKFHNVWFRNFAEASSGSIEACAGCVAKCCQIIRCVRIRLRGTYGFGMGSLVVHRVRNQKCDHRGLTFFRFSCYTTITYLSFRSSVSLFAANPTPTVPMPLRCAIGNCMPTDGLAPGQGRRSSTVSSQA